jgi:hypothetical protein
MAGSTLPSGRAGTARGNCLASSLPATQMGQMAPPAPSPRALLLLKMGMAPKGSIAKTNSTRLATVSAAGSRVLTPILLPAEGCQTSTSPFFHGVSSAQLEYALEGSAHTARDLLAAQAAVSRVFHHQQLAYTASAANAPFLLRSVIDAEAPVAAAVAASASARQRQSAALTAKLALVAGEAACTRAAVIKAAAEESLRLAPAAAHEALFLIASQAASCCVLLDRQFCVLSETDGQTAAASAAAQVIAAAACTAAALALTALRTFSSGTPLGHAAALLSAPGVKSLGVSASMQQAKVATSVSAVLYSSGPGESPMRLSVEVNCAARLAFALALPALQVLACALGKDALSCADHERSLVAAEDKAAEEELLAEAQATAEKETRAAAATAAAAAAAFLVPPAAALLVVAAVAAAAAAAAAAAVAAVAAVAAAAAAAAVTAVTAEVTAPAAAVPARGSGAAVPTPAPLPVPAELLYPSSLVPPPLMAVAAL